MKAVFSVLFVYSGGGGTTLRRIVDLAFAPAKGMLVSDPAFGSSDREVQCTTLCLDNDADPVLIVHLGEILVEDREQKPSMEEIYKSHGWREASFDD